MGVLTGLKNAVDHFGTSACSKGRSLIESLRVWCCSRTFPSKYNVSGTKRTLSKVLGLLNLFKGPCKLLTCRSRLRPGRWQDVQISSTNYPYPGQHMQRELALETAPVWSKMSVRVRKGYSDIALTSSVHQPIFSPRTSLGNRSATVMPPSACTALNPKASSTRAPAMDPYDRAQAPQMAPPSATAVEAMY